MTKLLNRTFLHSFIKMVPLGVKFALFMPSGTILKVVQKNSYLYFCREIVFNVRYSDHFSHAEGLETYFHSISAVKHTR